MVSGIRHSGLETELCMNMFLANTSDINHTCRAEDHFCTGDARERVNLQLTCGHYWLRVGFRLSRRPHKSTCHAVVESFTVPDSVEPSSTPCEKSRIPLFGDTAEYDRAGRTRCPKQRPREQTDFRIEMKSS